MSKTTALAFVGLLVAAGFAIHDNREWIAERTGWGDQSPAQIRAIRAAKTAFTIDTHHANVDSVATRVESRGGELKGWRAQMIDERDALVFCDYVDSNSEPASWVFYVDSTGQRPVEVVTGNDELEERFGLASPGR